MSDYEFEDSPVESEEREKKKLTAAAKKSYKRKTTNKSEAVSAKKPNIFSIISGETAIFSSKGNSSGGIKPLMSSFTTKVANGHSYRSAITTDDLLLRRFLHSCHYSMERAKRTIDLFFTIRSTAPELFTKRDPWAPEIRRVFEITDMLPLPYKTPENYKVFIYRLNNPDLNLFDFVDAVKTFFMLADTRLTEDDDIPSGEIPIFDSANVSLKFIGKLNLSVLRKYMLYTQEAMPIRLKQVHVINAPPYIAKIHAICKPFLKTEVAKLIKFHEPNSDTLYKDIPLDILPNEYGGKAGTVDQIKRKWIKKIESKRDWFLKNDKQWAVDESLRPSSSHDERANKVRDLPGSFRTLALD